MNKKNKEEQTTLEHKVVIANTLGWSFWYYCKFDIREAPSTTPSSPLNMYAHSKYVCTFLVFLDNYPWLLVIKCMHFSFVICMHLWNIIVYLYAPNTTCAQQVFHIHTSQTDKLINMICVYIPTIRCYVRAVAYHVIWRDGGWQEDAQESPLAWFKYGHVIFWASRKTKLEVEVNETTN